MIANWQFKQHQKALTSRVGAHVQPYYRPRDALKDPPRIEDVTLELLLASQTHLGHHTSLWHPGNARYIHGIWGEAHDAIHIIGLDVTAAHLRRACKIVTGVAARGGKILFVGTRSGQALLVVKAAELSGGYHLFDKWIPGTLTNAEQILGRCTQKVIDQNDNALPGFEPQLEDLAAAKPDLVVCLNPGNNYVLLRECGQQNIPTIGIIDTDVNPTWVTYAIPANDDSMRSVGVIVGALGRAGEVGRQRRLRRAKAGHIDFVPSIGLRPPTKEEITASQRGYEKFSVEDVEDEEELTAEAQTDLSDVAEALEPDVVDAGDDPDLLLPQDDANLSSLTDYGDEAEAINMSQEIDLDMLAIRDDTEPATESKKPTSAELDLLDKSRTRNGSAPGDNVEAPVEEDEASPLDDDLHSRFKSLDGKD